MKYFKQFKIFTTSQQTRMKKADLNPSYFSYKMEGLRILELHVTKIIIPRPLIVHRLLLQIDERGNRSLFPIKTRQNALDAK